MSYDASKGEWAGVIEVYDKVKNGIYRANATTVVMFIFLLVMYFVVGGPHEFAEVTWVDGLSDLFIFFAVMWIIAFCMGYSGTMVSTGLLQTTVVDNVTPNSDLNDPAKLREDMRAGRLRISPSGIGGIIGIPWKDVRAITSANLQNVFIKKIEKVFGMPIGRRSVTLHFDTPEDAASFLSATNQYIRKGSVNKSA